MLGWQKGVDEADGGEVLLLPSATQMTMANVRTIDAAIERQAEAAKVKARSEAAARARATDPQREAIRAQMEADRRERAARSNFARQDNRASAVAKQHACRAIFPVQYAAKCFGPDD